MNFETIFALAHVRNIRFGSKMLSPLMNFNSNSFIIEAFYNCWKPYVNIHNLFSRTCVFFQSFFEFGKKKSLKLSIVYIVVTECLDLSICFIRLIYSNLLWSICTFDTVTIEIQYGWNIPQHIELVLCTRYVPPTLVVRCLFRSCIYLNHKSFLVSTAQWEVSTQRVLSEI